MNILAQLRQRFHAALCDLVEDTGPLLEMVRPAQDPRFGDYQANCAMPLGKRLGKPPREVAEQLVERLDVADLCQPVEIAGPGFINLRLRDAWLAEQVARSLGDQRLGVARVARPRTYVLDYSAPNVAKPMHVGHIRSTVIGDALYRMLQFLGHRAISDNHLGDWGTQFGMIIYGYKHFVDRQAYQQQPVRELARLYRLVNRLVVNRKDQRQLPELQARVKQLQRALEEQQAEATPADKSLARQLQKAIKKTRGQVAAATESLRETTARLQAVEADVELRQQAEQHPCIETDVLRETALLHEGDPENRRLWEEFLPACRRDIQRIYDRLGVRFDHEYGESFYQDMLPVVVDEFRERELARESEGAICVFRDGVDTPMIIRKQDGAFLYATTDLATVKYRMQTWQPDAVLYVVDHRQSEHFDNLFAATRRWGYTDVALRHISFGTVLDDEGRPFKTRSGDTVGLEGLLDEAVRRAYQVVAENDDQKPQGAELTADERQHIARVVGHAAIKYADLTHNRTSDYVFSYDKMVAMEGNTATYMQYSYARTQSIFGRGAVDLEALRAAEEPPVWHHPLERALALELLRFEEALQETLADYRPNLLTGYLFNLAKRFSEFYQHPECKVLKADTPQLRESRLRLCDLTGRTLRQGLNLLGIEVVDKM